MGRLRWLGAAEPPIVLVQGVQYFSPNTNDAVFDLFQKASYEQVGAAEANGKVTYKLVPLGQGAIESVYEMLKRLDSGTVVLASADAIPEGVTDPVSQAFVVKKTGASPVFFSVQAPGPNMSIPAAQGEAFAVLLPPNVGSDTTNAIYGYGPSYPADTPGARSEPHWRWACRPGYVWKDPNNPDAYSCVPGPQTTASSGGSDSSGLVIFGLLLAAVAGIALSGGGRKANPMSLSQTPGFRSPVPHVRRIDVTPAQDDGGRLRRPGYTIWDGNHQASPSWAPTLEEAVEYAISYGESRAGDDQALVVYAQDEATGKYQNVYQSPRRTTGAPAAVGLPYDWNPTARRRPARRS